MTLWLRVLVFVVACACLCTFVESCGRRRGRPAVRRYDAERAARQHRLLMLRRELLKQMCQSICATQWSSWSRCTQQCGGGSQSRWRSAQMIGSCSSVGYFACPYHMREVQSCNTGCPYGGVPDAAKRGCRCPLGRKGTCCETAITCHAMQPPWHGNLHGMKFPSNPYGSVVTYSCDDGYALMGNQAQICGLNGEWTCRSGQCETWCKQIVCSMPIANEHVRIINPDETGYDVESEVLYTCDVGYRLAGPDRRMCLWNEIEYQHYEYVDEQGQQGRYGNYQWQLPPRRQSGRWSGFDPSCEPVDCEDPGTPDNGIRTGNVTTYGGVMRFRCSTGHKLSGQEQLKCLASGRWNAGIPECKVITCEQPLVPENGDVYVRRFWFGTRATFECDTGYNLVGERDIQCTGEGQWNGTEPTCEAADCGNPGVPTNGTKDGAIYVYPSSVRFSCFDGFILSGAREIWCLSHGQWDASAPSCDPCAKDTYMVVRNATQNSTYGVNGHHEWHDYGNDTEIYGHYGYGNDTSHHGNGNSTETRTCVDCPAHSYTATEASISLQQCICDDGYAGEPGGPCKEIRCPMLKAPLHGSMGKCDAGIGKTCSFTCYDGYILDRGNSMRTCQPRGDWDGTEPECSPCLPNTYKSDDGSCLPCPQRTHTEGIAQMYHGCVCDEGYEGPAGGPCEDKDECEANYGSGPCDHGCENSIGSYRCYCYIQGYKPDPSDRHKCIVEKQCKNLTDVEAPEHGGLLCHWYYEENSQRCTARCNAGYEFPARIDAFKTCGPATGFQWTQSPEEAGGPLFYPCIEEFFPEIRSEVNSSYFVRDCQELSAAQQEEVKKHFAEVLELYGVCSNKRGKVCEVKNIAISCRSRTLRRRRRKRSAMVEELSSMDMSFGVYAFQVRDKPKDCPFICRFLKIPDNACAESCVPAFKRHLQDGVEFARRQLEAAYGRRMERMTFRAADRDFEPQEDGLHMSDVIVDCQEGQAERDGVCVPCEAGTHYSREARDCVPCPMGTYQLFESQTECEPCPEGSSTSTNGSMYCTVCTGNSYGPTCEQTCDCVNGTCDLVTGHCECDSGWEGDLCDIDTPGCRDGACFEGVSCEDVPAPGSGFRCGPCPPGYTGNGQTCSPATDVMLPGHSTVATSSDGFCNCNCNCNCDCNYDCEP